MHHSVPNICSIRGQSLPIRTVLLFEPPHTLRIIASALAGSIDHQESSLIINEHTTIAIFIDSMDKEKLAAPEAAVSNPASAPTTEATEEPEVDFNKLAPSSDRAATPEGNPGDRSDSEDKWAVKNKFNGVNLPTWIDELDNVYDHLSRLVLHGWMPAHYCDATEGFNAVRAQADKDLESVGLLWEIATCDMRVSCKVQLLREKLAQHSTAEQIRLGQNVKFERGHSAY